MVWHIYVLTFGLISIIRRNQNGRSSWSRTRRWWSLEFSFGVRSVFDSHSAYGWDQLIQRVVLRARLHNAAPVLGPGLNICNGMVQAARRKKAKAGRAGLLRLLWFFLGHWLIADRKIAADACYARVAGAGDPHLEIGAAVLEDGYVPTVITASITAYRSAGGDRLVKASSFEQIDLDCMTGVSGVLPGDEVVLPLG